MDGKALKTKLIGVCRTILDDTIKNLKKQVDEAQSSANDYGAPRDRYDSYRTQLLRKRDMFAKQLQVAYDQVDALNKIDVERDFEQVEFGCIVVTNKQKLFVSTSLGKIKLDDQIYYAISPNVPIFNALKGAKKGNTITFNSLPIEVKEVL
jgi:hypothetical protein